jgi:hypothetical protein
MDFDTFPVEVWTLQQNFKPVQVTITGRAYSYGHEPWHTTDTGKNIHKDELFQSKALAIAFGREEISRMELDLEKRRLNIDKKLAALSKFSRD